MKNKFFFFDYMLTPSIITFVYWVLLIGVFVGSIVYMCMSNGFYPVVDIFLGLIYMVVGFVSVRILCELLIVIFKINSNLQKIREQNEKNSTQA